MSNLKTSLKIAILAIVGLIMSTVAFNITGFEFIMFLAYVSGIVLAVSLMIYISGFVNRNLSRSKNTNAIILFAVGAVISFIMNAILDMELFEYIGLICVVLLFISIFIWVARKLFKNEFSTVDKTLTEDVSNTDNTENN